MVAQPKLNQRSQAGVTESESNNERIAQLEKEVARLRQTVEELKKQLAKLDVSNRPPSRRVTVIGSLGDKVSRSMNPDA